MRFCVLLFLLMCFGPVNPGQTAESQVQSLTDFRYPMMVYVPTGSQRTDNMVIALSLKKSAPDMMKEWEQIAKKTGLHVLAVEIDLRDGEQPTFVDRWLLNLKREMGIRYRVKNFYLLGYDDRAHYASYFGLSHPKAFTAYAAIGGSWAGPFQKMVKTTDKAKKQAPFFIAMPKEDKQVGVAQAYATDLTAKGYDVRFIVLDRVGEASSDTFLNDLISWFNEQHRKRNAAEKEAKTFREKFSKVKEEFFAV